jgi:hypothetical protein
MDRLIQAAWRAFWVGLGASAVLITQSVLAPSPAVSPAAEPVPPAPLFVPANPPAAARLPLHTDPVLSNIPRCETVASRLRCS